MKLENAAKPTTAYTPHKPHIPQPISAASHPDALLQAPVVQTLLGIGKSTLFAMVREGRFPRPIKISARCTRWKAGEVTAWLKSQGA